MSIENHFNKTIKTQRLAAGAGDIEGYQDNLIGVRCEIQPLEESSSQDLDGNFGKDWLMFCNAVDIQEGDRIVDGATEYRVVGVESFEFLGETKHMECRIRKFNQ